MPRLNTYLLILLYSAHIAESSARIHLSVDPPWTDVFIGDTVTLTCQITGTDAGNGWEYSWIKHDGNEEKLLLPHSPGEGSLKYTVNQVKDADSAQYWCTAKTGNETFTSSQHTIKATALPKPELTFLVGREKMFSSEKVSLRCDLQGSSTLWEYKWYKDGQELGTGETHTVLSVTQSDTGTYTCRGQYQRGKLMSKQSDGISLEVSAVPEAVLTLQSGWTEMFPSEKVTLRCDLQGSSSQWDYKWFKDRQELTEHSTGNIYTIQSAKQSDSGTYTCSGQYQKMVVSSMSKDLSLTVLVLPKAVLTVSTGWTEAFPTEKVTLRCDLQGGSSQWEHKWFKDGQELLKRSGDTLTIPSATQFDTGQYSCKGQYRKRTVLSDKSNDVSLKVSGSNPNVVLARHPSAGEIYTGETVTLSCSVEGSSRGWQYRWYKSTQEAVPSNTDSSSADGPTSTISSAALSDSGQYWCQAGRGNDPFHTDFKNSLNLRIAALPKAVLSLQSRWTEIFPTEKATLSCDLQGSSSQWGFMWYKDGQELVNRNGDTLTIHSATLSDTGRYSCKGRYGERTVFSDMSNGVSVEVSGSIPKPLLRQDPPSEEMYTGDKLTLNCTVESPSTGWQYLWYKDTQEAVPFNTDSSSTDGSSYGISSADVSHGGRYWCRARRGTEAFHTIYSDSLTLNISVRPQATLTLETEWIEIFSTNHLTLKCDIPESSVEWNYTWYRDGHELPEAHTGQRYTVTSGASLYTCKGKTTKRPFHTFTSETLALNNILLKRKILVSISGCLILGPFLVILGCLLLRMNRKSDEKLEPASKELFTVDTINAGKMIPIDEDFCDSKQPGENGGTDAENAQLNEKSLEEYEDVYSSPINLCSFTGPLNN